MNEPNSLGNPEYLKDLKFDSDQSATSDLGWDRGESQARSDATELADVLAADQAGEESRLNGEESRLNEVLTQARLAIGAAGAAVAVVSVKTSCAMPPLFDCGAGGSKAMALQAVLAIQSKRGD